ncbi:MAG: ZIP family metal transporter [bacterium]
MTRNLTLAVLGLFPLALLAGLVAWYLTRGVGFAPRSIPLVEDLHIERIAFAPHQIVVSVQNTGPVEATIAQVFVNEAIWEFSVQPSPVLKRLERATVYIPHLWVESEPYQIDLITSTGLKFSGTADIAVQTPRLDGRSIGLFSMLGVYAGVIPVFLGLLWHPFLRRLKAEWRDFFVNLTAGVLIFLGIDVVHEALEIAGEAPEVLQGVGLVGAGVLFGILGLMAVGGSLKQPASGLVLAYFIAAGIGLHNFGEGLAMGAAYTRGEVALGALLVVGFTVHNATEGFAIVGPIARQAVAWSHLVWAGAIAGAPTVLGAILGGVAFYAPAAAFAFAVGAGAIFYVVFLLTRDEFTGARVSFSNFAALLLGMALMYATSLMVVA